MPTRYLKPGIRDSELIDRLSPMGEVLYCRLLVTVDDFGRFDARPAMLKAACFPIKEAVGPDECAEMINELAEVGLVDLYLVQGKPYLQLRKWDNAPRAKESKFPAPADGCAHMHTTVRKPRTVLPETETETETENREPEPIPRPSSRVAPTASAAGSRPTKKCPASFELTPELQDWAAENCPGIDPLSELAKMRDHTFSTARVDWAGTWRNWMRKAFDSRPSAKSGYAERRETQLRGAAILTGAVRSARSIAPDPFLTLEHDDGKAA